MGLTFGNEFTLSPEELTRVIDALGNSYHPEAVTLVHTSLLISPRLIYIDIIPGPQDIDLIDPNFKMQTSHILATMRIVMLSEYGSMAFDLMKKWGLYGHQDVNTIIEKLQEMDENNDKTSPALWASSLVETSIASDGIFQEKSFLEEGIMYEIHLAETALQKAMSVEKMNPFSNSCQNSKDWDDFIESIKRHLNGDFGEDDQA
jgi:hypothetical protein